MSRVIMDMYHFHPLWNEEKVRWDCDFNESRDHVTEGLGGEVDLLENGTIVIDKDHMILKVAFPFVENISSEEVSRRIHRACDIMAIFFNEWFKPFEFHSHDKLERFTHEVFGISFEEYDRITREHLETT